MSTSDRKGVDDGRRSITKHVRSALVVSLLLAIPQPAVRADCRCRRVSGRLASQLLSGSDCHSPVSLCTRGRLFGGFHDNFVFTATSMTASIDTPTTGVLHYTGDMVVTTADGDLYLKESGAYNAVVGSSGDVGAVSMINGGTGRHASASGYLRFFGTFTMSGGGHSDYEGEICH